MDNMNRRKLLLAMSGSVPAIAGCLISESTVPGISQIQLTSFDSTVNVELTVKKEGNVVYEEIHEVNGRETLEAEEWMGERVNYELTASIPDGQQESVSTAELDENWGVEDDCLSLIFNVRNDKNISAYMRSQSCESSD